MSDKDEGSNQSDPTADGSTESGLAGTLTAVRDEIERLERQSTADSLEVDYADELGGASIRLNYHNLGGSD